MTGIKIPVIFYLYLPMILVFDPDSSGENEKGTG